MVGIADMTITLSLPPLDQLLILLLVGLVVGLVAEAIVGPRAPLGFVGAVMLGLLGAWIAGHVLHFSISPEYTISCIKRSEGSIPNLSANGSSRSLRTKCGCACLTIRYCSAHCSTSWALHP